MYVPNIAQDILKKFVVYNSNITGYTESSFYLLNLAALLESNPGSSLQTEEEAGLP